MVRNSAADRQRAWQHIRNTPVRDASVSGLDVPLRSAGSALESDSDFRGIGKAAPVGVSTVRPRSSRMWPPAWTNSRLLPGGLRAVEGRVGAGQARPERRRWFEPQSGHSTRLPTGRRDSLAAHSVGEHAGTGKRCLRHDDDELIVAVAGDEIAVAHAGANRRWRTSAAATGRRLERLSVFALPRSKLTSATAKAGLPRTRR